MFRWGGGGEGGLTRVREMDLHEEVEEEALMRFVLVEGGERGGAHQGQGLVRAFSRVGVRA